ncbi:MAG: hypothetical protein WCR72_12595 [Bacteroidota bacterium]
MAFAILSSFVLLALNDILLTLVQIILLCYLNFFERRNTWWLIPALVFTAFALYIKAFAGIVSLVITASFAGIMIYRTIIGLESRYRLLMFLIVPFVSVLIWFGLCGDLHGLTAYFKGMLELAADNSAAVAVYPLNNWWVTGTALACGLALLLINLKVQSLLRFTVLAGTALFAIWKYGMAREDYLHTSMMFVFILFTILVFQILAGSFKIPNLILSVLVVVLFYISLQKSYYFEPFQIQVNGAQNLFIKSLNRHYVSDTSNISSEKSISRNKLDKRILDMIGKQTVDIYPWDYSYIAANRLNWLPRPVIQSYASYTRELDDKNAIHFESGQAPVFIIWELRKITHDIHGGTIESIDGRYLLNDEPDALLTMFTHYELVATQAGEFPALIYRKRTAYLQHEAKVIGHARAGWDTWIDVPDSTTGILRASADMQRSIAGSLKSFFYKDEATYVYYQLSNGDIRTYRIVPKTASYGLWINPQIVNPERGKVEPLVKKIMFRSSNPAMMKDEIGIKWEQLSFSPSAHQPGIASPNVDPVYPFFGIRKDSSQKEVLTSLNDLESNAKYWSTADESKLLKSGSKRFMLLSSGDYSVSFEYPLDSIAGRNLEADKIIRTGAWVKGRADSKAVYVISIEKEGKSCEWKAVDIQNFLFDSQSMNFVTNYTLLDKELKGKKGLMLKVYAWNTGEYPIMIGDFSVRVETH